MGANKVTGALKKLPVCFGSNPSRAATLRTGSSMSRLAMLLVNPPHKSSSDRRRRHRRQDQSAAPAALDSVAWHGLNANVKTHPVGQKRANAWGLYDLLGNVEERCGDWHGSYPSGTVTDPLGPSGGSYRVHRGGSFAHDLSVRASWRKGHRPGTRSSLRGFRLARSAR